MIHPLLPRQGVLLRRQYSQLPKPKRAIEISSLAGNPIALVKRKHNAKGDLNPSPRRRNAAPLIHMGAANNQLQDDRLIANVPLRYVNVEVGKGTAFKVYLPAVRI